MEDHIEYEDSIDIDPGHRPRTWFLTINNHEDKDIKSLKDLKTEYCIIADEVAPTTGTPHVHCYVRLKNGATWNSLKKKFATANIQLAKGNDKQNQRYCSKEKVLWESGTPSEQGKRNDIQRIHDLVKQGATMRDIIPSARSMQSIRVAQVNLVYFEPPRSWKPQVFWFFGLAGTGKTRLANELFPNAWVNNESKWFEGYDAHEDVIFDNFSPGVIPYDTLLRLLDRYQIRVECKGGSRQFLARRIIITSTLSPKTYYSDRSQDGNEVTRRIDRTYEFPCSHAEIKANLCSPETVPITDPALIGNAS